MIAQKLPTLVLASMKVMDADYERRWDRTEWSVRHCLASTRELGQSGVSDSISSLGSRSGIFFITDKSSFQKSSVKRGLRARTCCEWSTYWAYRSDRGPSPLHAVTDAEPESMIDNCPLYGSTIRTERWSKLSHATGQRSKKEEQWTYGNTSPQLN